MKWIRVLIFLSVSTLITGSLVLGVASAYSRFSFRSTNFSSASDSRDLYEAYCQRCHTLDGQPSTGPTFKDIAITAAKRKEGMSAAEYIIESISNPSAYSAFEGLHMPEVYQLTRGTPSPMTDENILKLTDFLLRQNNNLPIENVFGLSVPRPAPRPPKKPIRLALIQEGEEIFRGKGKCATCHYPSSYVAPSLEGIGQNSEDYLRDSIINPSKQIASKYRSSVIEVDGSAISGVIKFRDAKRILMSLATTSQDNKRIVSISADDIERDADGNLRIKDSPESIMPSYKDTLSDHEIECLVELMRTLD